MRCGGLSGEGARMAIVSLIGLIVMLLLVGAGIALGAAAAVATVLLVTAGVVSSSVAVGLWRGKAEAGLRALLIQVGIVTGIPAGMLCTWVATQLYAQADAELVRVLAIGAVCGALSGLVVALLFDFIARRVQAWITRWMEKRG